MITFDTLQDIIDGAPNFLRVDSKRRFLIAFHTTEFSWAVFDLNNSIDIACFYESTTLRACCYIDPESFYAIQNLTNPSLFATFLKKHANKTGYRREELSIHALHILFLGTQNRPD